MIYIIAVGFSRPLGWVKPTAFYSHTKMSEWCAQKSPQKLYLSCSQLPAPLSSWDLACGRFSSGSYLSDRRRRPPCSSDPCPLGPVGCFCCPLSSTAVATTALPAAQGPPPEPLVASRSSCSCSCTSSAPTGRPTPQPDPHPMLPCGRSGAAA